MSLFGRIFRWTRPVKAERKEEVLNSPLQLDLGVLPDDEPMQPLLGHDESGRNTYIGPDLVLLGSLAQGSGEVYIAGALRGRLHCADGTTTRIGPQGTVCGEIDVDVLEVAGTAEGEIAAHDAQLRLHSRCRGRLFYHDLSMQAGDHHDLTLISVSLTSASRA